MAGRPGRRPLSGQQDDWDDDEPVADTTDVIVDVSDVDGSRAEFFEFTRGGEALQGFVVRHQETLRAYVNRCPHALFTLDFGDRHIHREDGEALVCWSHGAQFRLDDGRCVAGPCRGRALEPLPLERAGGVTRVVITAEPEGWPRQLPPPVPALVDPADNESDGASTDIPVITEKPPQ